MQCVKSLVLQILVSCLLICAISCQGKEAENSAAPMHSASKRSTEDYVHYYVIQPRTGKQYPQYYTTVRCRQYYRKPGKRPQCLEDLQTKPQTTNGSNFDISRADTSNVSNKLDETLYQQLPVTALPAVIRVPIQTLELPKLSQHYNVRTPNQYDTATYQRNSIDLDAQVAELEDILDRTQRKERTSLLDMIFSHFKQRRRIQEQIAATYLKHYGESK